MYVQDDLNLEIIITPSHFLSPNTKTGIPAIEDNDEIDNPDYEQPYSKKDVARCLGKRIKAFGIILEDLEK